MKKTYINIILIFLILVGIFGIFDTMVIAPVSSSISLGVVMPAIIGVLLIIFALINLLKKKPIFKKDKSRRIFVLFIVFCLLFFAVTETFIIAHANDKVKLDKDVDVVLVLGCGIFSDGRLTNTLRRRLDLGILYLEEYPESICVVSGGQGPTEPTTEAYAMKKYMLENGVDENRVIEEGLSTSTDENIDFSKEIINTLYPDNDFRYAIISSDFHVFRVKMLAKNKGLDAIGSGSETPWYLRLNCYLREFVGVWKSIILDLE